MTEVSHDPPACAQAGAVAPGEDWIAELTSEGAVREDALRRLHALLLRGARAQVSRMSALRAAVGSIKNGVRRRPRAAGEEDDALFIG